MYSNKYIQAVADTEGLRGWSLLFLFSLEISMLSALDMALGLFHFFSLTLAFQSGII